MEEISIFWLGVFSLTFFIVCYVLYRSRNFKVFAIAFFICLLVPSLYVEFQCILSKASEACVWGRSLLLLYTLTIMVVIFPILFLLLSFILHVYRKK